MQVSSAPYFDDPLGDSLIYYERARQILAGRSLDGEIYFHSAEAIRELKQVLEVDPSSTVARVT